MSQRSLNQKKRTISLVIITKDRPIDLSNCLKSIEKQSCFPDSVLIIDNNELGTSRSVCQSIKKIFPSLQYFIKTGTVPSCRNYALKKVKTKCIAFVDDDCTLESNWIKSALESLKNNQCGFVLGKITLSNPDNLFALGQYTRDSYWKHYNLKHYPNEISKLFDTKNVAIKLDLIKKHKISFDEKCQFQCYDSADFEFGIQLKKLKIQGCYDERMRVSHRETSSFKRFKSRALARGKLAKYIQKKHNLKEQLINSKDRYFFLWIFRAFKHFSKDYARYFAKSTKDNNDFSLIFKVCAYFVAKLYERYYAIGFTQASYEKR